MPRRAAEPPPAKLPEPPVLVLTEEFAVSEARAPAEPPPATPAPARPAPAKPTPSERGALREVKVVEVPQGGFVFVEGNAPVAVALDTDGAGRALALLLGGY
jgi:hypothetical protein